MKHDSFTTHTKRHPSRSESLLLALVHNGRVLCTVRSSMGGRSVCDQAQRLLGALLEGTLPRLWVLPLLVGIELRTNLVGEVSEGCSKRPKKKCHSQVK